MKGLRIVYIFLSLYCINISACAQTTARFDSITARYRLRIGTRDLREIVTTVNSGSTHFQSPTAKSVYTYVNTLLATAGGDLNGSYPNPTVDGLQGRPVVSTAPSAGQALKWNGSAWAPGNDSIGNIYTMNGSLPSSTTRDFEVPNSSTFYLHTTNDNGYFHFQDGINTLAGDVVELIGGTAHVQADDGDLNLYTNPSNNGLFLSASANNFIINAPTKIIDSRITKAGLIYGGNYRANFVDTSLVDKKYVDDAVTASGVMASNGLTKTAGDIKIGGTGTQITNIDWANFGWTNTWNSLTAAGLTLSSNSTAAASGGAQRVLRVDLTGANATANRTTYAIYSNNDHTGTTPTNIAVYGTVSGGSTNYGVRGVATQASATCIGVQGEATSGSVNWGVRGFVTAGEGVRGEASSGNAVVGISSSGYAGNFQTSSGIGLNAQTTSGGAAATFLAAPSSTNTVITNTIFQRSSSGTGADGIGQSLDFTIEASDNTLYKVNEIRSKLTTANAGTRVSELTITGVDNAITADLFQIAGNGQITSNKYGAGTFTGTLAKVSGWTSAGKFIELTPNVSGTATLVAGTVTVSTALVATGDKIMVSHNTFGGTPGILEAPTGSIVNATSFVINSTNAADTSTVNYVIIKHD